MAQYTRFEIYLPVVYRIYEQVHQSARKRWVVHALRDELLREFIEATKRQYKGVTQANPLAPALFKGWWQSNPKRSVQIDYLTYVFGMVRIDESEEAKSFFTEWKQKFELNTDQELILLVYYPVQTIGDFF